jgi:hypothetical protein
MSGHCDSIRTILDLNGSDGNNDSESPGTGEIKRRRSPMSGELAVARAASAASLAAPAHAKSDAIFAVSE